MSHRDKESECSLWCVIHKNHILDNEINISGHKGKLMAIEFLLKNLIKIDTMPFFKNSKSECAKKDRKQHN